MAIVSWWNQALEALSGETYFLEARRKTAGQGLVACENLFNTYVRAVCGQQVNTAVAEKMALAVFGFAGDKGDNAAVVLAESSVETLRALGLSQAKAGALVAIAQKYVEGSFTAQALESLDDTAVRSRLTAVKGVGPWTADIVLIFGLNRPDVWAQTDFGLRKALEITGLGAKDPLTWAPWRTAATWLLWQRLTSTPVQY